MARFITKIRQRLHRPWFGSGVGAVLVPLLGLCLLLPIGKGLQDWSYDLPFLVRPETTITNIMIVKLDDPVITDLKQNRGAFDRSLHAELVRRLNDHGPKLIVFDIIFSDIDVNGTTDFANAMLEHSNVVIAARDVASKYSGVRAHRILPPVEELRTNVAAIGLAIVDPEAYFGARQLVTATETNLSNPWPSLAWQAAALVKAEITIRRARRLDEQWLNYYSAEPFQTVSYIQALSNSWGGISLSNKVVFIGETEVTGYVGEEKEVIPYPWTRLDEKKLFHGVEVHALSFSNLERGDWLWRLPGPIEALIIALIGASLGYGLSLLRPLWATVTGIVVGVVIAGSAYLLFTGLRMWFPWLIIVAAQVPMTIGWAYLVDSIQSHVERRLLIRALELYLSSKQVREILKQPELLKPGGQQMRVSIMFTDIANFSKVSGMVGGPDPLLKLLNDYYKEAVSCIHEHDGTVVQLVGDAILTIWNAPLQQSGHEVRACRAALALHAQIVQFNAESGQLPLRTRMGLHTGNACVGNIGGPTHFVYTALGDEVNMTSRLEGLNKQLGTNILVTHGIQECAKGAGMCSRLVGYFRFKGVIGIQKVYQLGEASELGQEEEEWRQIFAKGLHFWVNKRLKEAEDSFEKSLKLRPGDGPSAFYLERIPEYERKSKEDLATWLGEVDLSEK